MDRIEYDILIGALVSAADRAVWRRWANRVVARGPGGDPWELRPDCGRR